MDKDLHKNIGDSFREGLENMSQLPGSHIWQKIEDQLDQDLAGKYRRIHLIIKTSAAIFLITILSLPLYIAIESGVSKVNLSETRINNKEHSSLPIPSTSLNNKTGYKPILSIVRKHAEPNNISMNYSSAGLPPEQNEYLKYSSPVNIVQVKGDAHTYFKTKIDQNILPQIIPVSQIIPLRKNLNRSRLSVSASSALEFAGYDLENDEISPYANKNIIEGRENHLLSFSAGISAEYEISRRVSVQSGVVFSISHISINPSKIYAEKNNTGDIKYRFNTSSGYTYLLPAFSTSPSAGDSLYTRVANHTLQFLSIPVIFKYHFANKRITYNPGVGILINYLKKAYLDIEMESSGGHEKESISKLEGLRNVSYSLMLSSEVQYHLSEKWALSVLPCFKYALAPINKGNVVKTYPYTIGLGIGAQYRL